MSKMLSDIKKSLRNLATSERAKVSAWFFKTGKGEYGEGDKFLGITVPDQRKVAKKFRDLSLKDLKQLLDSAWHEERLTALYILVDKFMRSEPAGQREVYNFYLKNLYCVNNWDLVDSSAHKILGAYMLTNGIDHKLLERLAASHDLWERRVAVLTTFAFIAAGNLDTSFSLAEKLRHDQHDLIHKAVGWMLREAGKIDLQRLDKFLDQYAVELPRTMLRYAIEKFPESKRQHYLRMR